MKIKRIYHHHEKWEEFHNGMWRTVAQEDREKLFREAIEFTGNAELYGKYMFRVIKEWPISCEHNLTCTEMNRQAWIGHAATCLAIKCPEDITRQAWHQLTKDQQDAANAKADEAIKEWENAQCQKDTSQLTFFHLLQSA